MSLTGNVLANLNVTGNIAGGNVKTIGLISATGNLNSGNVNTTNLSLTGNILSPLNITGNVTAGNLLTTGLTSTSNLTVSNTSALGSITTFSQSQYALATSGTVNINKNNGQVQYLAPTNTVSIGDLQNFVATAGGTTQADTVTLVVRQGATPYTVAMPTGNTQILYAGNVNLISSTANSMTMVSITSVNTGTNTYLVSISPEFV